MDSQSISSLHVHLFVVIIQNSGEKQIYMSTRTYNIHIHARVDISSCTGAFGSVDKDGNPSHPKAE